MFVTVDEALGLRLYAPFSPDLPSILIFYYNVTSYITNPKLNDDVVVANLAAHVARLWL